MRQKTPTEQRFWPKVLRAEGDGCWEWQGAKSGLGYGRISKGGKGSELLFAHRYSYELHFGEFDKSKYVCHRCDNPGCVNPSHLFLGTGKENALDKFAKGRSGIKILLSEASVREIRKMKTEGVSLRQIASSFGVHKATICCVLAKRSWGHVE